MAAVSTRPADERELLSACPALAGTPLADLRSSDVKKKLLSMPVSHIFPGTRANEALTAAVDTPSPAVKARRRHAKPPRRAVWARLANVGLIARA
mmetsp:Transcript_6785/g.19339  ORF Transcript_6785/g.19339 Transcript_6785/m.19339 type:complete len:95 (+) Transcript_6785:44-328(+)